LIFARENSNVARSDRSRPRRIFVRGAGISFFTSWGNWRSHHAPCSPYNAAFRSRNRLKDSRHARSAKLSLNRSPTAISAGRSGRAVPASVSQGTCGERHSMAGARPIRHLSPRWRRPARSDQPMIAITLAPFPWLCPTSGGLRWISCVPTARSSTTRTLLRIRNPGCCPRRGLPSIGCGWRTRHHTNTRQHPPSRICLVPGSLIPVEAGDKSAIQCRRPSLSQVKNPRSNSQLSCLLATPARLKFLKKRSAPHRRRPKRFPRRWVTRLAMARPERFLPFHALSGENRRPRHLGAAALPPALCRPGSPGLRR